MVEASLIQLLTEGGIPAMFAALLMYTLHTSAKREERLLQREEKVLAKLDELAQTISRISTQLDTLTRDIDRMRGND
jgi:outer membrane murein-binding lipoprotein Lpp